jgi:enterochelin esterase family protein
MGARQSCAISRAHPGTFSYIGMFSGAVLADTPEAEAALARQMAPKVAPTLYWIGVGSADGVKANAVKLRDYCKAKGYPVEYYESDGGHTWRNWRVYLTLFAQKIFQ